MITEMHGYFQAVSRTEEEAYKDASTYRRENWSGLEVR